MEGSTHLIQAIRYVMNGSRLKGIRCFDSGITRYSVPLTLTLSPRGRGGITFYNML
jgi:hypothetical protein